MRASKIKHLIKEKQPMEPLAGIKGTRATKNYVKEGEEKGSSGRLKAEVLNGEPVINKLVERVNTDFKMIVNVLFSNELIARKGFNPFGDHRLISNEEKGTSGNLVNESGGKNGSRFHINAHAANALEVFFKLIIVLPHAPVGSVNGSCPIIFLMLADGCRHGLLEAESGQSGHLRGHVIVAGTVTTNGSNGENEIAHLIFLLQPPALTEEEERTGLNGAEQINNGGSIGASHSKINNGDAHGSCIRHYMMNTIDRDIFPLSKQLHIEVKISEQDVFAKVRDCGAGVARQPIVSYFVFGFQTDGA